MSLTLINEALCYLNDVASGPDADQVVLILRKLKALEIAKQEQEAIKEIASPVSLKAAVNKPAVSKAGGVKRRGRKPREQAVVSAPAEPTLAQKAQAI